MNCIFVQISTNLINAKLSDDIAAKYYRTFWQNKEIDGFYKSEHFWEIPVWIAELSYTLPDSWSKELCIVTDIESAIVKLSDDSIDYIFFSCMESNKDIIAEISSFIPLAIDVIIGGYCKPNTVAYRWYDGIQEFCNSFDIPYKYGTDYSLFRNYRTIPRLELSDGCKHHCKFCTIGNEIVEKTRQEITKQLDSFWIADKTLDFKLIYLNDKTFGQASNYRELYCIAEYIKKYINPNFEGFIIQTTCNQICKPGFIEFLKSANVKYVELGIESFNDSILKAMNKPQNESLILSVLYLLYEAGIKVIGNIIIGLPGETIETYANTIDMLELYDFYSLNINNLALYDDAALSDEIEPSGNDSNELVKDKSYHDERDKIAIDWFYDRIFRLGLEIIA